MTFINALSSYWLWGLLACVPPAILALYFLKLRRQPLEVPSTYLWSRTIEDLHVNSIWQRLRQSLLLFLQLLVVGLAMLALTRPGWHGTELVDERIIFLIDNSASMSATDLDSSRLEVAKTRVLDLIDQLTSRQVAMVISFSDVSRVEQQFTNNRSVLRQKVNRIQPTSRRSNPADALRYAASLANPGRISEEGTTDVQVADALPATLYIFSDGGFDDISNFSLGNLTPNYLAVGDGDTARNVGIVAFSTERNPEKPDQIQVFARLENTGPQAVSVDVSLYLNDNLIDAGQSDISPDEPTGIHFDLPSIEEGILSLAVESRDHLALDDRVYEALSTPRRAEVLLVTPGNDALEFALTTGEAARAARVTSASPDVLGTAEHHDETLSGKFDLVVYDQCVPERMPQANTLFIGNVPPLPEWTAGERQSTPVIIDTDPAHPLTNFVEMADVKYNYDGFAVTGPEGSITLFEADIGPILVAGHREGFEDVVLGMDIIGADETGAVIAKTEWPRRRSFPVFAMNVLRYLGGARGALATPSVQPGTPVMLRPIYDVQRVRVLTPSGSSVDLTREGQNTFLFAATDELGVYQVQEGSEITQHFTVNLFDARESDLRPRETVNLGYEEVAGRSALEPARQELWKWLLIACLAVLMFEWYVYNRRVYL